MTWQPPALNASVLKAPHARDSTAAARWAPLYLLFYNNSVAMRALLHVNRGASEVSGKLVTWGGQSVWVVERHAMPLSRCCCMAASQLHTFSCSAARPPRPAALLPPACLAPAVAEEALTLRVTLDTPSTNLVRKMTFALLNIPSFSDTTMNCRGRTQQEQAGQQRCE